MAGRQGSGGKGGSRSSAPKYPRGARVGATLREIIADELVRIDDERLLLVSITSIDVDPELNRAFVYFDSLEGEEGDEAIVEALGEHRVRLQSSIARQIRAKKTPILEGVEVHECPVQLGVDVDAGDRHQQQPLVVDPHHSSSAMISRKVAPTRAPHGYLGALEHDPPLPPLPCRPAMIVSFAYLLLVACCVLLR